MKLPAAENLTELLRSWSDGDQGALEQLVPLVYAELHRLARRYMRGERQGHTLQTTALINEAFLRLIDWKNVSWQNRAHFFGASAQLMRRILVDFARSRRNAKRGGEVSRVTWDEGLLPAASGTDVVAVDDALKSLEALDSRKGNGGIAIFWRTQHRGDGGGSEDLHTHGRA
jgi:RNA polymerase sigma-70 factor, ECF subfamily